MKNKILTIIENKILIIDGATGTAIQNCNIPKKAWLDENGLDQEGCNELLNATAPHIIKNIHEQYIIAGAHMIKTNTFGAMDWVLDEYNMSHRSFELSKKGAQLVKEVCNKYKTTKNSIFVLGSIGPGTKLPSLKHISYDKMYNGYKTMALGLVDGGVDIFLLETCQDPLQIKAAIHALEDHAPQIPIMVSVTIELSGTMLIGTDIQTIATILEPFNILSLGLNCGTGPEQILQHIKILSELSHFPLSIHSNAGLPQNIGGKTHYPMNAKDFGNIQRKFLNYAGVSFLGGCCGTTPEHIKILSKCVENLKPKKPIGKHENSIASLFNSVELKQNPAPLLIGERSNATGSKAFRELLKAENFAGTLSVGQEQVRSGAHVIDVSVGFAGRNELIDMNEVVSIYNQKIPLPLMPDSTQISALKEALKLIGGKPILNSVNLENGMDKLDEICSLAKKFGTSLVCLAIDEVAMAKTKKEKISISKRIYERAVYHHKIDPENLIFDMLVFTLGSGDEEYHTAGIETIEAIREFSEIYPKANTTLGLSNISFGLDNKARMYLNSIFLAHCVEAGLTSAIVNVKHLIPKNKMNQDDIKVCEDLIFNNRKNGDPLFTFIDHFSNIEDIEEQSDEEYLALSDKQKVKKLLIDGEKERMLLLVDELKEKIPAQIIVNDWLIAAMKIVGELFGSGQMQLPFVLQSAETMKKTVDFLNPYLPKITKKSQTTMVIGTVKGDVHDVGKNLVDIILSNNGFKVINLGIKVSIDSFVEATKKYNADVLGMSGLLVKSTNEMKANLIHLQELGIKIPVVLGGAALTKSFVDDFCRPFYDGPIFYARDAFDGVVSMQRVEFFIENIKQNKNLILDTKLDADLISKKQDIKQKEKKVFNKKIDRPIYLTNHKKYKPPFYGIRDMSKNFNKALAFEWLNHRVLFRQRWGYKKGKQTVDKFLKQENNLVVPLYEKNKDIFLKENILDPIVIYGYFPCKANDTILEIYDEKHEKIIASFDFPRQGKSPHRSLTDYFKNDTMDIVAFTFVSTGHNITPYEKSIYDNEEFKRYYLVHGLGVELAEALAEIAHKQVRLDLNIINKEKPSLNDVQLKGYQGCRYSPGYAACPDLSYNKTIFDLLEIKNHGIVVSETFQMHPEQTTCAIIVPNEKAVYFNI